MFEAIFKNLDRVVWNMFKRIAAAPELETLRNGVEFFSGSTWYVGTKALQENSKLQRKPLTGGQFFVVYSLVIESISLMILFFEACLLRSYSVVRPSSCSIFISQRGYFFIISIFEFNVS